MTQHLVLLLLLLLLPTSFDVAIPSLAAEASFLVSKKPAPRPPPREKLSHFRFYLQDILSGPSPTTVRVAQAATTIASATAFGAVVMFDDPLTVGPELSSRLVGRAQGMYAVAAKEKSDFALLMAMNFAFIEGMYNGSTITILGRNAIYTGVREMPIVGGSGLFRLAKGYAKMKTYSLDPKTGDTVVEYNLFVTHY